MSAGTKAVNYISIIVGGLVGLTVGLIVWRRTMARAAEIAREEGAGADSASSQSRRGSRDSGSYADAEAAEDAALMLDPDDLMMDGDDISLWGADEFESGNRGGAYRDTEEGSKGAANGHGKGTGGFRDEEEAIEGKGAKSDRI
jgi:hypothetical protein